MHVCVNIVCACTCTCVCNLKDPCVCGLLYACHTRGPFKLGVICTVATCDSLHITNLWCCSYIQSLALWFALLATAVMVMWYIHNINFNKLLWNINLFFTNLIQRKFGAIWYHTYLRTYIVGYRLWLWVLFMMFVWWFYLEFWIITET